MKKQITALLAVVITFGLLSCQKEDINKTVDISYATASSNADHASKMVEAGVPFKASFQNITTPVQGPPNIIQRVNGIGSASHMGEATFEAMSYVNRGVPAPFPVHGTRTITAANGDKVYTTFTGTSTPVVNSMNGATLYETITGGTGRFTNASGSFTSVVTNNFLTSSFRVEFNGRIKY